MARSRIGEQQLRDEATITHDELAAWAPENFTISGTLTLSSGINLTSSEGKLTVDNKYVPATTENAGFTGSMYMITGVTTGSGYEPPSGGNLSFDFNDYTLNSTELAFDTGVLVMSSGTPASGTYTAPVGVNTFIELEDTPVDYSAGEYLVSTGSGIEFVAATVTTFSGLPDTPSGYDEGKYLKAVASGTEWAIVPDQTTFSGTSMFVDGDATVTGTMYAHIYDSYSPLTIKDGGVTVIAGDGAGTIDFPLGITVSGGQSIGSGGGTSDVQDLLDLTDTPSTYSDGLYLKSTSSGTEWATASGSGGVNTFYELADTPPTYDDGKYLRSTFLGTEWAEIPTSSGSGAQSFLELTDTPAAYESGSYIRSTESGIEFTSTVATTSGYTGDITVLTTGSGVYAAPAPTEIAFNFTTTTAQPAVMSFSDGVLTTFSG